MSLRAVDTGEGTVIAVGLGWAFSNPEAASLGLGMFEGRFDIEFRSL